VRYYSSGRYDYYTSNETMESKWEFLIYVQIDKICGIYYSIPCKSNVKFKNVWSFSAMIFYFPTGRSGDRD
jgi:hypothetical protein